MAKELEFGTGGIRAVMGPGMDQLNIYTIRKNTEGYARYIDAVYADKAGSVNDDRESRICCGADVGDDVGGITVEKTVVIAYDNRNHSKEFADETANVLASHGIRVYMFDSLRPTPELSFAVRYLHAFGGVVITASHNPPQYNGYKIYDMYGCQCVPRDTDEIIRYIKGVGDIGDELDSKYRSDGTGSSGGSLAETSLSVTLSSEARSDGKKVVLSDEVDEAYYRALETIQLRPDLQKEIKIVYTPLHGTGYVPVTTMLGRLGYEYYEVSEQCEPDGDFSHTASPNPEDKRAFDLAIEKAKKVDADIIMATDPDCDRIGLVVKHENLLSSGFADKSVLTWIKESETKDEKYVYLTGNQVGAIFIKYLLETRKQAGTLPEDGIIFDTIVTSDLGVRIAKSYGIEVESTLTGFKFIGDKIREYEGQRTFLFGYEESYGYMIGDFTRDKDGVQAAIMAAEVCNYYKLQGKTLVDVLLSIYNEYGYSRDVQESQSFEDGCGLTGEQGRAEMERLVDEYRSIDPTSESAVIEGRRVVAVEDYKSSLRTACDGSTTALLLPKSNVIKLFLEDGSWVVVRPSGNEPKIKYYKELRGDCPKTRY